MGCPWHVPIAEKGHDKAHALRTFVVGLLCGGLSGSGPRLTLPAVLTQSNSRCLCLADFQKLGELFPNFSPITFRKRDHSRLSIINDRLPLASCVCVNKNVHYVIVPTIHVHLQTSFCQEQSLSNLVLGMVHKRARCKKCTT